MKFTPEITIILRICDTQLSVGKTIESILMQTDIDFKLIIVNDGSDANTAAILKSFSDTRLKILTNAKKMGSIHCYNLVIKQSRSPFIVIVEQGNVLLPEAIKKLVATIKASERIGQVHCYYYYVDQNEGITRKVYQQTKEIVKNRFPVDCDYKKLLLFQGLNIDGVRIYRRDVFLLVDKFERTVRSHENFDFSIRLLEKYEISVLPEVLYYRVTKIQSKRLFDRKTRLIRKFTILSHYLKLLMNGSGTFLRSKEFHLVNIILQNAGNSLAIKPVFTNIYFRCRRLGYWLQWHLFIPLFEVIYTLARKAFGSWPFHFLPVQRKKNITPKQCIAYYLWTYPGLSETFIQREVATLKRAGISVHVISDIYAETDFLPELRELLSQDTHCSQPFDLNKLSVFKRYFFYKNPITYLWLFLYVVFHDYHVYKNFGFDKSTFMMAIYLAGLCKENRIKHIHSPWSDYSAFISLIAARLLGITYSVQARAHDIHRKTYLHGLHEKFENAKFIVTNTKYNVMHIRSILNRSNNKPVHLINNGLNLERFVPNDFFRETSNPIQILCVARLIEQKGLVYLLKACNILKQKGFSFQCKIIGGPEKTLYMRYYVTLKKLHRNLGLDKQVFFAGKQYFSSILEAYRHADIFVLPCIIAEDGSRDITPNSLIEAMAMKLPVISTPITGIPEIVEDGVTGILVPPKDEVALSEALIHLITHPNLRAKLSENARREVEKKFNIEKNIRRYVALFEDIGIQNSSHIQRI